MSKNGNAGAAFPRAAAWAPGGSIVSKSQDGMTLRDYLVAHAPVTIEDAMLTAQFGVSSVGMLNATSRRTVFKVLALLRNEYADAMLEALP